MSGYDANKIEEYQLILLKNPRSKVFAALAEAYRKMGMLSEALETTHRGLQYNPDYVSGLVAQARVLFEMNMFKEAIPCLQQAIAQKPENLLALRLLAHCHIKLKNSKEALKTYKTLLFYNPHDEKAARFVKKWEFLEADQFSYEEPLIDVGDVEDWLANLPSPAEFLTVVDAYIARQDIFTISRFLQLAEARWPEDKEIQRRKKIAQELMPADPILSVRKAFWEKVLQRVEERKNVDPLL